MSGDEVFVLIASCIVALIAWARWYLGCCLVQRARVPGSLRLAAALVPVAGAILLIMVLLSWSSFDVRSSSTYTFFYLAFGAAWVGVFVNGQPLVGISFRDDVLERRNSAALVPVAGSLLGLTFCFAGANIGDGPGWWVVLFCAALATGAWFLLWLVLECTTHIADHVTIDRDAASAWRLAGYLAASGIFCGRAVAGDWQSAAGAIRDAVQQGWPAVLLLFLSIGAERFLRPTPQRPEPQVMLAGWMPALLYVCFASIWLYSVGPGN